METLQKDLIVIRESGLVLEKVGSSTLLYFLDENVSTIASDMGAITAGGKMRKLPSFVQSVGSAMKFWAYQQYCWQ